MGNWPAGDRQKRHRAVLAIDGSRPETHRSGESTPAPALRGNLRLRPTPSCREGGRPILDRNQQGRLAEAVGLALAWHAEDTRKGTTVPYVSHLLQVAGLVLEFGGDVDQAVTGLLHDALEDAPDAASRGQREQVIAERFGEDVHALVLACSDTGRDESASSKRPWKARKQSFLKALEHAPARSLMVIACDKLHNLRSLVCDIEHEGPVTLERFNAPPAEQAWYFEGISARLNGRIPGALAGELDRAIGRYRALTGQAG